MKYQNLIQSSPWQAQTFPSGSKIQANQNFNIFFHLTHFARVVVVIENVLIFWQINYGQLKTAKCRLTYQVSMTCWLTKNLKNT